MTAARVVVGSFTPSVVLSVARRTGRLDEVDLEVDEVPVSSSPGQFGSLLAGDLDIALTSPDNVLAYRFDPSNPLGRLADVRIVATLDRGTGLALYARRGLGVADLAVGRPVLGVDVATSGFALAMYAVLEQLGLDRSSVELVALGSTPRRQEALREGRCDATMLNAGNELAAEEAGCTALARVADVCPPYVGTVVCVEGERHLDAATRLAGALRRTGRDIVSGDAADVAVEEAADRLGLPGELAARYVARLRSGTEGLILDDDVDLAGLATIVRLRQRFLAARHEGVDVLEGALGDASGLVATGGPSTA